MLKNLKEHRSKQAVPIGEVLIIKETNKGYYLFINNLKQKLRIYNGEVLNDLTPNQMNFVNRTIKIKKQ